MTITFNPVWNLLIGRNTAKEDLHLTADLSPVTIAKIKEDGKVASETFTRMYTELDCRLEQVAKAAEIDREEGENDE